MLCVWAAMKKKLNKKKNKKKKKYNNIPDQFQKISELRQLEMN